MPALYNLSGAKLLDDKFAILGVDRDAGTDDGVPGRQKTTMESFTPDRGGEFAERARIRVVGLAGARLHYMAATSPARDVQGACGQVGDGNAIFYLAVADRFFGGIIDQLHAAG